MTLSAPQRNRAENNRKRTENFFTETLYTDLKMISEILSAPGIPELLAAEGCFKVGGHFTETVVGCMAVVVDDVVSAEMKRSDLLSPAAAVAVELVTVGREDLSVGTFEDIDQLGRITDL